MVSMSGAMTMSAFYMIRTKVPTTGPGYLPTTPHTCPWNPAALISAVGANKNLLEFHLYLFGFIYEHQNTTTQFLYGCWPEGDAWH